MDITLHKPDKIIYLLQDIKSLLESQHGISWHWIDTITKSPDSTTNTDAKCNCDQHKPGQETQETGGWWCPVHGHLY